MKSSQNTSKRCTNWSVLETLNQRSICHMIQKSEAFLVFGAVEVFFYGGGGWGFRENSYKWDPRKWVVTFYGF